jgi:hypothetical protein
MEKYEPVRDIGSGNFGVARLMRNCETRELVAVKCMERGPRVRCLPPFKFLVTVCSASGGMVGLITVLISFVWDGCCAD